MGETVPQQRGSPSGPSGSGEPALVWLVWAGLFVASLYFVATWGRNEPYVDDKDFLPVLNSSDPTPWRWIWQQHNEHRMPLPKILMLVLYRVSGHDFRSGMYYNACALAAGALALILAARRIRGWTAATDVFFPLLLMHWGYVENLIWFSEMQFISSTALAVCALAVIAGCWPRPSPGATLALGICLTGLAACGATGLVVALPLTLWLGCYGLVNPRQRISALVAALPPALLWGLYWVGYQLPADNRWTSVAAISRTAAEVLSMSFVVIYEWSVWPTWGVVSLTVLAIGLFLALRGLGSGRLERWRAAGLLSFLLAMMLLALAIGVGRARFAPGAGLQPRYFTLVPPLPCAVYMAAVLYERGRASAWLRAGLVAVAVIAFWFNTQWGLFRAKVKATEVPRGHLSLLWQPNPDDPRIAKRYPAG